MTIELDSIVEQEQKRLDKQRVISGKITVLYAQVARDNYEILSKTLHTDDLQVIYSNAREAVATTLAYNALRASNADTRTITISKPAELLGFVKRSPTGEIEVSEKGYEVIKKVVEISHPNE